MCCLALKGAVRELNNKKVKGVSKEAQTELIKMKINVEHAENLFQKAVKVLNEDMPDSDEDCEYCEWKNDKN